MKNKKAIAFIMSVVLIVCCFASGMFSAFAKTQELVLDTEIINTTDGLNDNNWYYFTPEQTGMYTFLSFSRLLYSEAYLFVKEGKDYTQLAYSNRSPNYSYYGQTDKYRFCLSYQLEAGKTYYYAAGWDSDYISQPGAEMKVKLIYEGSEEDVIQKLEVTCNAELSWYTDGSWETDSNGEAYFNYNYSKILQNMIVTVYYSNGTQSSTDMGGNTVDGYTVKFTQNQAACHWYPKADEKYTQNTLTISILNVSTSYDVVINQDALFTVYGRVCDIAYGDALRGATLSINGSDITTTDAGGSFSFVSAPGVYNARISGEGIIPRSFKITVYVNSESNNHNASPIAVAYGDWVKDGIINAKDFGYIQKTFAGSKKETEESRFAKQINFTSADYNDLVL